jgi:CHAT domain-containing protein/tetratricopeptide (TPR) repeat protein
MRVSAVIICVVLQSLVMMASTAGQPASDSTDNLRMLINDLVNRAYLKTLAPASSSFDSCLILADSAVNLAATHYGPRDTAIASALITRAFYFDVRAQYSLAEQYFKQAITIWQANRGADCLQQVRALGMLANCYNRQHKEVDAENCYRRGLALMDAAPAPSPAWQSLFLNCYAGLCQGQQRYDEAEALFRRALQVSSAKFGEVSYQTSVAYINLGQFLAQYRDDLVSGEGFLRKALDYYDHNQDTNNYCPDCGPLTRLRLSQICYELHKYDEASTLLERAVSEMTRLRGRASIYSIEALSTAANYESRRSHWVKAMGYAEELVRLRQEMDPDNTASLSSSLFILARCYYATGELQKSLDAYSRAVELRHIFISGAFAYASERSKILYLKHFPLIDRALLSAALHDQSSAAVGLAFRMVLAAKGAMLDALSEERQAASCADRPDLKELIRHHGLVCDSIANNSLVPATSRTEKDAELLSLLYAIKDSLELKLSQECAQFGESLNLPTVLIDGVAAALPARTALWEYVRYHPYSFNKPDSAFEARYLAFTLDAAGHTRIMDLGDAGLIDSLVNLVHQNGQTGVEVLIGADERQLEKNLKSVSSQLAALVFAPLAKATSESDHIFISPDGQLSLLPFEILPLSDKRYAIEQYEFTYLSSGRDLVRRPEKRTGEISGGIVVAAPDFEMQKSGTYAQTSEDFNQILPDRFRGPSDRTECLSVPFNPLPAAGEEGRMVSDLLSAKLRGKVVLLSGPTASEDSLKHLSHPPRVLHLATHGYFCSKASYSDVSLMTESPLLYSGLVLAGCNRTIRSPGNAAKMTEDGILTALEVSGLNLMGTDLVVLSSCRAGVGPVLQGEGVYGLRRAFQLAGVHSVIMSMFDVPDMIARNLMTRFYTDWLSGTTKSKALRNAMLAELRQRRKQHGAAHPLFWGGFILTGNPT